MNAPYLYLTSFLLILVKWATLANGTTEIVPLGSGRSRKLFFDRLRDCQKTALMRYRERILGPNVARTDSNYFNLQATVEYFGDPATAPINPSLFAPFLLFSELERFGGDFEFENQSFGRNGEYTEELRGQHAMLTEFWGLDNRANITLLPMHSESLEGNLEPAIQFYLNFLQRYEDQGGISFAPGEVTKVASSAKEAIDEIPGTYSNADLTLNALFTLPTVVGNPALANSTFILMGDGALDYFDSSGYGEVGSDFTHAHEFAHAVIFYLELKTKYNYDIDAYFVDQSSAVSYGQHNAQAELEADAMAAYALAHERGRNFSIPLLVQAAKIAMSLGDRLDFLPAHHGTPEQRECAARFGADEGLNSGGNIMTSQEFHDLFLANYYLIESLNTLVCVFDGANDTLPEIPCESGFVEPPSKFKARAIGAFAGVIVFLVIAAIARYSYVQRSANANQPRNEATPQGGAGNTKAGSPEEAPDAEVGAAADMSA